MSIIHAPTSPTHDIGSARFTSLATPSSGSTRTAAWMVELDAGIPGAPHSLTDEEVFIVLHGAASVAIGGHVGVAQVGDAIVVPANTEFSLANAGNDPLRLLCCLPVGGQAIVDGAAFTPPWTL